MLRPFLASTVANSPTRTSTRLLSDFLGSGRFVGNTDILSIEVEIACDMHQTALKLDSTL
jgi:hypothetical protein